MRVLMLTQFYPPVLGGQERHVRDLAMEMVRRGHEVEVATIASDRQGSTAMDASIPVHRLPALPTRLPSLYSDPQRPHATPFPDPTLRRALRKLLLKGRFDVAHAHDWSVNSLLRPAERLGVPVVMSQHDYGHSCATKRLMRAGQVCSGPGPWRCITCAAHLHGPLVGPAVAVTNAVARRRRTKAIDAFIPVSEAVRTRTGLEQVAGVHVIPNFVADDLLVDESEDPPASDDPTVLFVGDLTIDKGIGVLLDAHRLLRPPPRLVLAGRVLPDTPPLRSSGIEARGPVQPDVIRELMRKATVVVVPSRLCDACPSVVLEAMAAARPVVASAMGGITQLVEDGETGILVPPDDPEALATAIGSLISDPDRANRLGRHGLRRVHLFTASVVAARVEAVYRQVARG